jgi:hypothetical protein
MDFKKIAFRAFASVNLILILIFQLYPVARSETWDFQIFFGAAHNVLTGMPVYGYYGSSHLPYFLFPWGAWFFIPFALLPLGIARVIFTLFGIAVVLFAFNLLANYFGEKDFFRKVLLFSMALWLGWLNIYVGQITYYLLGAAILVMFLIQKGQDLAAGLFFPVFLIKPHLFILFLLVVVWLGGKKTILSGAVSTGLMVMVAVLVDSHWISEMLNMLSAIGGRIDPNPVWGFITLPVFLGFDQNWIGTANLLLTIVVILVSGFILWKVRSLPVIPLLSLALTASLVCAPRAYAYDLPLLIPAILWLSGTVSWKIILFWLSTVLILLLSHYSVGSYLLVLTVFGWGVYKAYKLVKNPPSLGCQP